jgi:hypothetical protein
MTPEAQRRLGHALQAIQAIHTYTADAPLLELDSWLEACALMRDWQHPVAVEELQGFVAGDLQVWQGSVMAGMEQAGRGGEVGSADRRESEGVGI